LIAREQDAEARAAWRQQMAELAPEHLVFLDETSTPLHLTPLRARALRGQRVVGRIPRGRWTNVTLLATLTAAGLGPSVQFAGALDRPIFETFVEMLLVPKLRPGQVVVLDNLSVHKSARARSLIEAAGCQVVFLPTYSPDDHPIEQAFAKLKQRLRQVEARTIEAVMRATQHAYPHLTASDAQGFFRAAGYNL
jgi:transposase